MHRDHLVGNRYFVPFFVFYTESVMLGQRFIHESIIYTQSDTYTWIFENRVSEDKSSFYYLAIKSNKIRPKAEKKAYIWRRAVS